MCGIAGFSGSYDADLLHGMNARIAHRGPDDADTLLVETAQWRVGLAHRRLSIIDLSSSAHEPMGVACERCGIRSASDPNRGRWLVYNGEIYNYRELRAELEAKGHQFFSKSDTEVLLHLYEDEGPEMLPRLNGMFAFALFDGVGHKRAKEMSPGSMLVARDGFGVKPFYYTENARGFAFSSELKALLLVPEVSRDLDLVAMHEYLAYLWASAPQTPLKSVRKLPPGNAMVVRGGKVVREWTYYDWPYGDEPMLDESEEQIAERVRQAFDTAVDRQLVADVPVGAFLSGGLDSSSIVAAMRRRRPNDVIPCYSIGFRGDVDPGSPSDLPYARKVAEQVGVDLRVIELDASMIDQLERMIWHLDEPQGDPAPINSMLIADQARADGVKVLMSGTGGDDVFSGYRRHTAVRFEPTWSWLPSAVRHRLARTARGAAAGRAVAGSMHGSVARRVAKVFSHADVVGDERLASYFLWSVEEVRRGLYAPAVAAELATHRTTAPLLATLQRIPRERDPLNRMLYLEAKHFLADHNLNYADKTTMAAGVESRVPFLDPDLVRLATRIPPRMKQKGRLSKAILKKAMEPYLPHDVIYRPKTGFGAPIRRRGLFDPIAVRRLIDLDAGGRVDASYTVFALLCIELWCRKFVDL